MKKVMSALVLASVLFYSSASFALTPAELRTKVSEAYEEVGFGELDKAMQICNEVIEVDPKYAAAYAVRSMVNYNLGEDGGALDDAIKAIELPSDGKFIDLAYYSLADISYHLLADYPEALGHITKAIELTQDTPYALYYDLRSEIHKALGSADLADQDKAKADALRVGAK